MFKKALFHIQLNEMISTEIPKICTDLYVKGLKFLNSNSNKNMRIYQNKNVDNLNQWIFITF